MGSIFGSFATDCEDRSKEMWPMGDHSDALCRRRVARARSSRFGNLVGRILSHEGDISKPSNAGEVVA